LKKRNIMKAFIVDRYKKKGALRLGDMPEPALRDDDRVVATAILDRLLHHSHVITIRGDSYRLRAKRRSGLLPTRARRLLRPKTLPTVLFTFYPPLMASAFFYARIASRPSPIHEATRGAAASAAVSATAQRMGMVPQ
jgi:hypothetical protein